MTLAFHGDHGCKAALLATIDRHVAADTLRPGATVWDGTGGSPLGIAIEGDDLAVYAARTGYPIALAGLLDPLAALLHGEAATRFVRDWVAVVEPGADLADVPTRLVLDLLTVEERALAPVAALHRRTLDGEAVTRREWAAVRADLLAAIDDAVDDRDRAVLALAEACSWPAAGSRSILATAMTAWCALGETERDADWSDADAARAQATLGSLWEEQGAARSTGEPINFPALFAARDPDLARRFEANLGRVNARRAARLASLVRLVIGRLAEAPVVVATA